MVPSILFCIAVFILACVDTSFTMERMLGAALESLVPKEVKMGADLHSFVTMWKCHVKSEVNLQMLAVYSITTLRSLE